MKRAITSMLGAVLLLGCDGGRDPLAKAAAAEAGGSYAEAAALYRSVCDKGSSLCRVATRRIEAMRLKEADKAIADGDYRKAKATLDAVLASSDAGTRRAAEAMSKLPDLEKGLAWEDAAASADKEQALAAIAPLAEAGVATSPKAKEWLAKNRPRLLLDQVKAACTPVGKGSCADLGAEIARRHPGSPEATEAAALVAAEYARVFPLLQQAENLIGQRVMIWDKDHKIDTCLDEACALFVSEPPQPECLTERRPGCEQAASSEPMPTVEFLTKAWDKKLDEIHDPHFVRRLKDGWALAEKDGLHDAEPWPKPAGKK